MAGQDSLLSLPSSLSMSHFANRRTLLRAVAAVPLATTTISYAAATRDATSAQTKFLRLERELNGRLGVFALDTRDGTQLAYRSDERFAVCSTLKVLVAAGILKRSEQIGGLMRERIRYSQSDLVTYSPITEKYLASGMTVADLCDAMMRYSDNTAANLLMKILGGPEGVTAFARSIGDREFRLDHWEPIGGDMFPGDVRDTSTPKAMGLSLQRLALGNALAPEQRKQLQDWLRGNATGATCIRAGVPEEWEVGDKTGAGSYGTRNDIAVLWPPHRPPVIVAVYSTQHERDKRWRDDVVASAARIVVGWVTSEDQT